MHEYLLQSCSISFEFQQKTIYYEKLIFLYIMRVRTQEYPEYEDQYEDQYEENQYEEEYQEEAGNTHTLWSTNPTADSIQQQIQEKVDERGFYLYNWITPDELQMSVKADYLSIVQASSIPLAVITLLFGFIGLSAGMWGVIMSVLGVLGIFYLIVGIILIIKMIKKSYLYTRSADVVITDSHIVSGGKVLDKNDFDWQKSAFSVMETIFREPLFEESKLSEYVALKQRSLMDQLQIIASGGGRILENIGNSRDSGAIALVIIVVGFLYSAMMGIVYFAGVWIVAIIAKIFSWFANKTLLAMHNKEHTIQSLFHTIMESSIELKEKKKESVTLLTEAWRNDWVDNLSGKLHSTFEVINNSAETATESSIQLRNELENSEYKNIFNFPKYDNWIKSQILTPLEELLELVESNERTISQTLSQLDDKTLKKSGDNYWGSSTTPAIEAQKKRFELQLESFERIRKLLESYISKLS